MYRTFTIRKIKNLLMVSARFCEIHFILLVLLFTFKSIFSHYILAFKISFSIAFKLRGFSSQFSSWSSRSPSKRTIQRPAWKTQYLLRSSDHSGSSSGMRYTTKLRGNSTRSYWNTCRDRRQKWSNLVHCGRLANHLRQSEKRPKL